MGFIRVHIKSNDPADVFMLPEVDAKSTKDEMEQKMYRYTISKHSDVKMMIFYVLFSSSFLPSLRLL